MAKSQPDFTITVSRNRRRFVVLSHKDAAFKKGQVAAQQMSGSTVAFVAVGASKPEFSFAVVDGDEAVRLDAFVTNPRTGKPYTDVTISWVGRRAGETVAHKFEECCAGEGGSVKTTEGEGFTSDGNFKFLMVRALRTINGAAPSRVA
ncbi:MAG: hypothetical protein KBF21_15455 [Thermoanaerobaculia bacterium]|nr:hypothetical protein [Thermoanaerobaculia bacterium]